MRKTENLIKQGHTKETLLAALHEVDACTKTQRGNTSPRDIVIQCQAVEGGQFVNWVVKQDGQIGQVVKRKGKGFDTLFDNLNEVVSVKPLESSFLTVLCYTERELAKKENGKISTTWIELNPLAPFDMIDGVPKFSTMKIDLSEDDFKIAMESRIALFDDFTRDFFPIRTVAFSSVGKILDTAGCFKSLPDIPIGPAMIIASRLVADTTKEYQLIYRNYNGQCKPLIGLAGPQFGYEPDENYFRRGIGKIEEMFGPGSFVGDWKITDEVMYANVYVSDTDGTAQTAKYPGLGQYTDFPVFIRLQTSDIPGTSASATAFAKIENTLIMIQKNSEYRRESFLKKGGVECLFSRKENKNKPEITLKDNIDNFVDNIRLLKETDIVINDDVAECIRGIGKRINLQKVTEYEAMLNEYEGQEVTAYDILIKVLRIASCSGTLNRAEEFSSQYNTFVDKLVECAKAYSRKSA